VLKATRTGHEAAAEEFRVTSNKYTEQAALVRDLLQAQARSSETAFQYQQALSSYWSSLADLRRAMERNKSENHNRNLFIDARHGRLRLE